MQIKRQGFGQVEPNHIASQITGQSYAQLPAAKKIKKIENGQLMKYHYSKQVCDFTDDPAAGPWMLVFNEVKLYDDFWRESVKDFAMKEENYTPGSYEYETIDPETGDIVIEERTVTHEGWGPFPGTMYPRLLQLNLGDIYTTNCIEKENTDGRTVIGKKKDEDGDKFNLKVGDILSPNPETGFLTKEGGDPSIELAVVKCYTMPDGQPGVKLQVVGLHNHIA